MLTSLRNTFNWSALGKTRGLFILGKALQYLLQDTSLPPSSAFTSGMAKVYLPLFWKYYNFHKAGIHCPQKELFSKSYSSTQYFEGMFTWQGIHLSESVLRIAKPICLSIYLKIFCQDPIHSLSVQKYWIICGVETETCLVRQVKLIPVSCPNFLFLF